LFSGHPDVGVQATNRRRVKRSEDACTRSSGSTPSPPTS
jgi:hypothetical protein